MPLADYLVGLAYLAATLAALGLATLRIARLRLAHLSGAPYALAVALVATALLLLAHLIPGLLGILGRETVLVVALLVAAATWWVPAQRPEEPESFADPPPSGGRLSWVVALSALGAVAVYLLAVAGDQALVAANSVDATAYQLPSVASWIGSGTLWPIDQFIPFQGQAHYPQHGNVLYLAAALPFENDFLVRFVNYPYLALAGVATYSLGRELGARRAPATLFAAAILAMPWVAVPAVVWVMPDAIMLATFGTGVVFLLRYARTGRASDLVLSGIGLGIAFGTKWYGVPAAAVVVAVFAAGSWLRSGSLSVAIRPALALSGLIAATGGIWMVRNLVESGSPIFPAEVAPLGLTIFDAPRDVYREGVGFAIADYLGDSEVLRTYVWPALRSTLGYVPVLVIAGTALALVPALGARADRAGLDRRAAVVLAGAACVVLIAVAYVLTPYSAFGPEGEPSLAGTATRYVVPGLMIAAAITAWATGRLRRGGPLLELAALLVVVDAVRRSGVDTDGVDLGARSLTAGLVLVLLAAGLLATARKRRGRTRAAPRPTRPLVAGAATLALAGLAAAGYWAQRSFNDDRYRGDPTFAWIATEAPGGHRVGLAGRWEVGTFPALPSFGPRFRNEVDYVGPVISGQLRRYRSRASFVDALRRGGYDLVLVGRGQPARPTTPEQRWVRSVGFREVATSRRFALYRGALP